MHLRHWRRASFRRASFRRLMAPDTHAVEVQMSIAKTKVGGEGPHVISMDGDRQPSSCAPPVEPSKMFSPFRSASRGSANGDGHYAACKVSGFKSVIDFPSRSGLNLPEEGRMPGFAHQGTRGMAIMDSGCRTAVAHQLWDEA